VQVVEKGNGNESDSERLPKLVNYGEEGQVVFHRLDESFFIPNMFERDRAVRIPPTPAAGNYGVFQDGVRNPALLESCKQAVKTGLY
ncbi:MAG: hypothetical protein GY951_08090, partial [Psychromonas sp.]|nr:hypothetical protein [Psychromonas sp.]